MVQPVEAFPPEELAARVQFNAQGKRVKPPVDLEQCKLLEMVQYACDVENRNDPRARITCRPLVRLFRRCANGLTVETTAWEDLEHRL
ncbi:hypothetical protein BFW01_g384 [Lasiodiplodia theobromae]|uniref:Mitochondrial export protein Som1 n=1 Tax=Lasiodiplodia theobromae TaxID=45133 RepID=A0A5N5CTP8_9PEZI|nr:uncharacterized protein LTHEOB_11588 [Lasiodiplodia theobromae]KAB2568725.1 hypothetical protein DBV05_g12596 [Lasiodiplodia theobromae]KAF4537210.1 hypothetical protein LTHEOB_11588 [Lasiodiplodia theobromae]KAF9630203.1 hypothetical protein BFW01_g384 [Lasiodiplodia theobromae]